MSGRRCLWKSLGAWLGLGMFCSVAFAQPSFTAAQGPRFPSSSPVPPAEERFYFAVMGQVARPGVYELSEPEPQLVELIRQAGGLTRQATQQISIVRPGDAGQRVHFSPSLYFPLLSGDIVVADGPVSAQFQPPLEITPRSAVQNADFEEASPLEGFRHVALVNVLDRPVILPVPEQHANLPAIVAYLGQHPAIRSLVNVQPVGPGREFDVPTVLHFPPQSVQRERLPKLPGVYRVNLKTPQEQKTAERPEVASLPLSSPSTLPGPGHPYLPIERFQRPETNSMMNLQGSSSIAFSAPPATAGIREQEQQFSNRDQKAASVPIPVSENQDLINAEDEETSWWPYLGMVLVVLISGGTWYIRWRHWQIPQPPPVSFVPEPREIAVPPRQEPEIVQEVRNSKKPQSALGQRVRQDKILASLVFNQLPVQENPAESVSSEPPLEKPLPRKVFRLDPPEPKAARVERAPYIAAKPVVSSKAATTNPPASEPAPPPVMPMEESTASRPSVPSTKDIKQGPGLLDRVLQQVHQKRAA